jgi:hypothetical protein
LTTASLSISRTSSLYDHGQALVTIDAREQVSGDKSMQEWFQASQGIYPQITQISQILFIPISGSYVLTTNFSA